MGYRKYTKMHLKRSRRRLPQLSITWWLIITNILCYILLLIVKNYFPSGMDLIILKTSNVISNYYLWTLFTTMFMHLSLLHIFVNMFSLFFVGNLVERIIGRKRFLWSYLISGIVASLFFVFFSHFFGASIIGARVFGSPDEFALGASGAIFGIAGILAVILPKQKVYLILGPLIIVILDSILPSSLSFVSIILNVLIFVMVIAMFSFNPKFIKIALPVEMPMWLLPIMAIVPLFVISYFVALPIGNTAHLGGLVAGAAYGTYLRNKYRKKITFLNNQVAH
jgi:membrane associated rhomboid family serine protease